MFDIEEDFEGLEIDFARKLFPIRSFALIELN